MWYVNHMLHFIMLSSDEDTIDTWSKYTRARGAGGDVLEGAQVRRGENDDFYSRTGNVFSRVCGCVLWLPLCVGYLAIRERLTK